MSFYSCVILIFVTLCLPVLKIPRNWHYFCIFSHIYSLTLFSLTHHLLPYVSFYSCIILSFVTICVRYLCRKSQEICIIFVFLFIYTHLTHHFLPFVLYSCHTHVLYSVWNTLFACVKNPPKIALFWHFYSAILIFLRLTDHLLSFMSFYSCIILSFVTLELACVENPEKIALFLYFYSLMSYSL